MSEEFFKGFDEMLKRAKNNMQENQGWSVGFTLGEIEGWIKFESPRTRYSRRQAQAPKKVTREQIESVLAEEPASFNIVDHGTHFFVKPRGRLGDAWQGWNEKLRAIDLRYVRWDPDNKDQTGGWRGDK